MAYLDGLVRHQSAYQSDLDLRVVADGESGELLRILANQNLVSEFVLLRSIARRLTGSPASFVALPTGRIQMHVISDLDEDLEALRRVAAPNFDVLRMASNAIPDLSASSRDLQQGG